MYLDERSEWILNDILAENKIHTKELCKKYNILCGSLCTA